MRTTLVLGVLLIALGVFVSFGVIILDQREVAFRTFLGEPEYELGGISLNQPVLDEPGLYLRLPVLHQVHRYDNRRLRFDSKPQDLLSSQGELMQLDYYAMWQIADPRLFYETFPGDAGMDAAVARIDNTTFNRIRNNISRHPLAALLSDERDEIMETARRESDEELGVGGIRVLDIRITGLDYPGENLPQVYSRMRTERERSVLRARAEGTEKARATRSKADEESRVIVAQADREAARLRGEGDAEAASIYGDAYGKDPEFYAFVRSLEAYRKTLDDQTTLILSPDVPFLKYLFTPETNGAAAPAP